jgi:hypothetical protein
MTHAGFPVWLVWQHVVFRWGKCTPALTDFNSVEDCVEVFRSDFQELVQRIDEKFASLRAQTALPGQQGSWWTLNNIATYYVIWGCMWHTHMISARSWSFWSCPGFDNFCGSESKVTNKKSSHLSKIAARHCIFPHHPLKIKETLSFEDSISWLFVFHQLTEYQKAWWMGNWV